MTKKIALLLFGHIRTYDKTYKKLYENIIQPQIDSGYEVDIFFHTWNTFEAENTYHNESKSLCNIKVTKQIENELIEIYKPKKYLIEKMNVQHGLVKSIEKVNSLKHDYEKDNGKYDFIIYTRFDIGFLKPFNLSYYLSLYENNEEMRKFPLPDNFKFCCNNFFTRFPVADPRYVNESDVFWCSTKECNIATLQDGLVIPINFHLQKDLILVRKDTIFPPIDKIKHKKNSTILKLLSCFVPSKKLRRKLRGQE